MDLKSLINDEISQSIHMNSIQFNIKDHQDLQHINKKLADTVLYCTYEDLKTEELSKLNLKIQKSQFEEQNEMFFYSRNDDQFDQYSQFKVQFTTEDNRLQSRINEESDYQDQTHKFQSSNRSKWKGQIFSKEQTQQYDDYKQKMDSSANQGDNLDPCHQKTPRRLLKAINLLVNVKSFYRLLTKNSRILGKLTSKQHYLIDDVTSNYHILKESNHSNFLSHFPSLKKVLEIFNHFLRDLSFCIPMFQPYNLAKFLWDIVQAILILSVMFLFSLIAFFQLDKILFAQFFQIVFIAFVLDTLFTFNTAVLEKGNVIFDRKKAATNYLKRNFIMDQIALLPLFMFFFEIELDGIYSWAIYFQILMKLFVLSDIFERLTFYLNYQKNMKNIVDIIKLIFIIGCVCHVFCLFWHGLAIYEMNLGYQKTWLQIRGIEDQDILTRYVQSFYYLATTMITVGYGDITPQTTYEIIFSTLTMFVTGFFYAFSLNKIGNIIENIEMKDKSYKQSMQIIHRLMRQEKVSQALRVQISNYLQYLYKESDEIAKQQENDIINRLSKKLKYDLIQEVQGKYLKDIEFIDKLQTKSKIVESMEECLYSPGEYIFRQGEVDDCSLYYIVKGSVDITFEYLDGNRTKSLTLAQLKKSQYFGEMQFIQGNIRIMTAQASDFCRMYKIPRGSFFQNLQESDSDFENFQMLKEAFVFKENQKLFKIKCYICNKTDHISLKCPKTHLTLSKQTIIQQQNNSIPHIQRIQKERKKERFNSLEKNFETTDAVFQFLQKEENMSELERFENELHLSQDEAFIEECLQELQEAENAQKEEKYETDPRIINEAMQEDDEDEDQTEDNANENQSFSVIDKNKKSDLSNSEPIYQTKVQQTTTDETKQQSEKRFLYKKIQSLRQRSKEGSYGEYQNITQQMQEENGSSDSQSLFQKLFAEQKSSFLQNSNKSSIYQRTSSLKKSQNEQINELKNQFQNVVQSASSINHNNFMKQQNESDSKKFQFDQAAKQDSHEYNIYLQKSQGKILCHQNKNAQNLKNSADESDQNMRLKAERESILRKSLSLIDLDKKTSKNNDQIQGQNNLNENWQKLQKQISFTIKPNRYQEAIQYTKQKSKMKVRKSKSFDETFSNQIANFLQQSPKQTDQSIQNEQNLNNLLLSQDQAISLNQNQYQKQNTLSVFSKNYSKQNSLQVSLSSFNSQKSRLKNLKSDQNFDTIQGQLNEIQNRRKSKRITVLRQLMNQKRQSVILSPAIQQQLMNQIQNQQSKNQISDFNQNDHNYQFQNKYNQDNQYQTLLPQTYQNRNSLVQNHNFLSQASHQMYGQPQNKERRSNIYAKNLIRPSIQEYNRSRLSNPYILLGADNKFTQEAYKKGSFTEFNQSNRIKTLLPSDQQLPIDSNLYQQNLLFLQDQNEKESQGDSSYIMLQIFDKSRIYKYYYPNFNINVVIQALKQNKENRLKQSVRQKQSSRNTVLSKKINKQITQNQKLSEKVQNFKKFKDISSIKYIK